MPENSNHIKITDTQPRVQYVADGLRKDFPFIFQLITNTDLEIYLGKNKQSSNYTVVDAGETNGGTVFLDDAPSAGTVVTLVRNTPIQRVSDFQESGTFQAKVLNDELDLLTAALQDVAENVRRSVKLAVIDGEASLDLPEKNARADRLLRFDAEGNAVVASLTENGGGDATPGGADAEVQFNDGGGFGGESGLTYAKSTKTLSVGGGVRTDAIAERTPGAGVSVDGLLIKQGMVEGRNISPDGAKLDGIAPSAITASGVTFENLNANADIGGADNQLAPGDHRHDDDYSAVQHDHDGAYAAVGHSHDNVYAKLTHAEAHASTGNDPLKLDGLAEPDDTTELDASITKHGLLPKLSGNGGEYLDGSGNWSRPSVGVSGNALAIDAPNYSINFLDGSASFLETGLTGAYVTQGTASFPNRQGDDTNVIAGTDYDGTHVAGMLWRVANRSYVAGSADFAGILGGYDCLNNQIGGWISGSNHSVLNYNTNGHSYIGGGSFNLIESARCAILGSTACAITGNSGYSAIIAGRESLIDDNYYSLVIGKDNVLNAGFGSLVVGQDLTVRPNHVNSVIIGRDAQTQAADTITRGSDKLVTENDVRMWSQVCKKRTTNATLTNMDLLADTFEAGKVYAGYVKVKLVGLHDDGVNGEGGNVFGHCAFEGETSFMWDEDSNHGNFNGGSNVSSPTYNLTAIGTDKIGVGTCQLAMNTGLLRIKVTGKAATTINWVAEIEVVSTAAVAS